MQHVNCGEYYFSGPKKEFHTKNDAQRHAEWKAKRVKDEWNEKEKNLEENKKRFVSVKVIQKNDHFLVDLKLADT